MRTARYALLAVLLALTLAPTVRTADVSAQGTDVFERGRDFYPFGPTGLLGDVAGQKLTVREVVDRSPGDDADVAVGSVIVGAAGATFGSNPRRDLAAAIDAAEGSDTGKLVLDLEGGKSITVELERIGAHGADWLGESDEKSATIIKRALKWLGKQQLTSGDYKRAFPTRLGGTNGHVVVTSTIGLAMMAAGSTTKDGAYEDELKDALKFVRAEAGNDPLAKIIERNNPGNWNQTNWAWAYSGIFAALAGHAGDSNGTRHLKAACKALAENRLSQEDGHGGWGHGPGGANALGYTDLTAVTQYVAIAFGLATKLEEEPDSEAVQGAVDYLAACVARDGGIRYGAAAWDQRSDVARTSATLIAFNLLGKTDHAIYEGMSTFVPANIDRLEASHQGYLMQMMTTAIACRMLGDDAWKAFWDSRGYEATLARQHDGSFRRRPTSESLMQQNNDAALGEAWATGVYALVLQLKDTESLSLLLGR